MREALTATEEGGGGGEQGWADGRKSERAGAGKADGRRQRRSASAAAARAEGGGEEMKGPEDRVSVQNTAAPSKVARNTNQK